MKLNIENALCHEMSQQGKEISEAELSLLLGLKVCMPRFFWEIDNAPKCSNHPQEVTVEAIGHDRWMAVVYKENHPAALKQRFIKKQKEIRTSRRKKSPVAVEFMLAENSHDCPICRNLTRAG